MKKLLLALVLVSVGGVMADAALPNGSYQKSCQNCRIDSNNVLTCDCKEGRYGTIHSSSLKVKHRETRTISVNYHGHLQFDN